jgi:hypothetical protein
MAGARPYRTSFSRGFIKYVHNGFFARDLDDDDQALIEHLRSGGRIECGSLGDFGVAQDISQYQDEEAQCHAHACKWALAALPAPPEYKSPPLPLGLNDRQKLLRGLNDRQKLLEYQYKFQMWERDADRRLRARGSVYRQAMSEARAELTDMEARNRAESRQRIALWRAQEAERAKQDQEQKREKARRELQRRTERQLGAEEMAREWHRQRRETERRHAIIEESRRRDELEWERADAEEHRRRLAAAAAGRQERDDALRATEMAVAELCGMLKRTRKAVKNAQGSSGEYQAEGYSGHPREDAQAVEDGGRKEDQYERGEAAHRPGAGDPGDAEGGDRGGASVAERHPVGVGDQ